MNGVFSISIASLDDTDEIFMIESSSFSHGWTAVQIREEISRSDTALLLAQKNGRSCGYASVRKGFDSAELFKIAVIPPERGRGTGAALLDAAVDWCRHQNAQALLLEVREDNSAALALYKKKGFRVTGKRKKYYDGITAAVLMERTL
jgi:ribosomal-protein-alanine N-acetyltransferase